MGESLSSFLEVKDYFETLSEYLIETLATCDITNQNYYKYSHSNIKS